MSITNTSFESGVNHIVSRFVEVLITPIIWLLTGFAIVLFFYGLTNFILNSEGSQKENGKRHMISGLVGLFIIFAVWGIIALIGNTVTSLR